MRIGIDARMYSSKFTGIGRYTYELIRNVLELDNDNEYYIFLRKSEYDHFSFEKKNVHKVLADIKHYSVKEQFIFPYILKKYRLDIVHFTHFNAPLFFSHPKTLVTIHDLTLTFFPGKKMTSFIHRFAYHLTIRNIVKKSKKVIAVSKNTKNDLVRNLQTNEDKVKVIYEAVNSDFQIIREPHAEKELRNKYDLHKPYLLYTGVWRSHKNVLGLLKAFYNVLHEHKIDCDLVITGKADLTYHEIVKTIKDLDLEKNVKLVGLVSEEDLVKLNNFAQVYVFPSFYEGFGLPPLEAMACGTVVAASNSSCIPEVCGEKNAIFFDPYNIEDMSEKIVEAYSDEKKRNVLIQNGFDHLKNFSWKKMAEKTLDIYRSL